MKLVFLCTSLAPGRDGVGDYVRQLAAACTELGHVCLLVAINDRHLSPTMFMQRANEVRLSSKLGWRRRAMLLGDLIRDFDPHWISWQLVPFGFHAKGVIPARAFALADALSDRRNHVLLHEIWLGIARGDRLRHRVLGALQRRRLLAFLNRLRPLALHTTNNAYQQVLSAHRQEAELLPLFGNIPVVAIDRAAARTELRELLGSRLPAPRWIGVLFGTIHPQWRPEPTLQWLRTASDAAGRAIGLLVIGRVGGAGNAALASIEHSPSKIPLVVAGAQPTDRISRLLQAADFGLATHPWALIEKSGSAAALLEHGLPVMVPRDDWRLHRGQIDPPQDQLLHRLDEMDPLRFGEWLRQRREPAPALTTIARRFVEELESALAGGALVA